MLDYQLALLTGSTSPLGIAIATKLALAKIPLCLTGRSLSILESIQSNLSSLTKVSILQVDLSKKEERKILTDWIQAYTPDLIINSAGCGLYGEALSHPIEEQLNVLEINISALAEITLHAAMALNIHKKKGTILNISSILDEFIYPTFATYSASKAFVTHLSKSLDAEFKDKGIRVLVSCPGPIDTHFKKRASKGLLNAPRKNSLSPEKAADILLWQLKKQKKVHIFPCHMKLLRKLFLLIPSKIRFYLLKKGLQKN